MQETMPGSILGLGRPPGEGIGYSLHYSWASLVAQMIKNAPAMQESWIQSLGQENPLKKGMETHFNFLAWRIPWTEEPGRLRRSDMIERLALHLLTQVCVPQLLF